MASFLQNNGDIILDAVLTDYGRRLLAKGDGSFKIAKFAFGDDEIDYSLFNTSSNTVLQDQDIMNTPILEAFTNNAASMKSQLMTLGADNLLYLPVLKQYTDTNNAIGDFKDGPEVVYSGYVVPVDVSTVSIRNMTTDALTSSNPTSTEYMPGVLNVVDRHIMIDQGIDSQDLNAYTSLRDTSPNLYETEYNIYVDNRFCSVGTVINNSPAARNSHGVDDDNIAVYKLTEQITSNASLVSQIPVNVAKVESSIRGTKGSRLKFTVIPNENLLFSDGMFKKYGTVMKLNPDQLSKEFYTLRMPIRVVAVNTGYTYELNVMFAKIKQP